MPAVEEVPIELWTQIVGLLTRRSDLAHVSATCRTLYAIAAPYLHQAFPIRTWSVNQFLRLINRPAPFVPEFLAIGVSDHSEEHDFWDSPRWPTEGARTIPRRQYVSHDTYQRIVNATFGFTSVRELVIFNVHVPRRFYDLIYDLPNLESLHVEACTSAGLGDVFQHRDLGITELTLRVCDTVTAGILCRLATASNLQTLRIDETANVFQECSTDLSQNIRFIYVSNFRTFTDPLPPEAYNRFKTSLTEFLSSYPHQVEWLSTSLPVQSTLVPNALPLLRHFRGNTIAVGTVAKCGQLRSLIIEAGETFHLTSSGVLDRIAEHQPELKSLTLRLSEWDLEVIHAVAHLFPNLERLKVTFVRGSLSDDELVGLVPRHLHRLRNLRRLEIFMVRFSWRNKSVTMRQQFPSPSFEDYVDDAEFEMWEENGLGQAVTLPDEEYKEFLITWKYACPDLREVQLAPGYVWRRYGPKDPWCKRSCRWNNGYREVW